MMKLYVNRELLERALFKGDDEVFGVKVAIDLASGEMLLGEHKGKHISKLPDYYVEWLCFDANLPSKQQLTAEYELERRGMI